MKKVTIKSAIPIYGAALVWLLFGLICPRMLLKLWFLAIVAVVSAAAYLALSRVFKGRVVEVREKANSGDKSIDALIEEGRARLDSLRRANDEIPDVAISAKLDRMEQAGKKIFDVLERDVRQANAVRRFMNYYLPTAEKLVTTYQQIHQTGGSGENIDRAMQSVENSLGMIADAFEKQLDNLYKDKALDVETDIDVLETMMAGDGLIRNEATLADNEELKLKL